MPVISDVPVTILQPSRFSYPGPDASYMIVKCRPISRKARSAVYNKYELTPIIPKVCRFESDIFMWVDTPKANLHKRRNKGGREVSNTKRPAEGKDMNLERWPEGHDFFI